MSEVDLGVLRKALETARSAGMREIELESADLAFRATLEPRKAAPKPKAPPAAPAPAEITAPCVGYFHLTKNTPSVGSEVAPGQVVGTVTALGLSNDVEVTKPGKLIEWRVKEGEPVMFGQVLGLVEVSP